MSRENAILSLLFGLLAAVILVVEKPFSADAYEETAGRSRVLFPEFDGSRASRIEIRAPGRESIVERGEGGAWKVTSRFDYPADATTIADLFSRLGEIRVSDWISNKPEDRDRYNVGEDGIRFRVTDPAGAVLAEFVQGKFQGIDPEDPNFQRKFNFDTFLRRADSDEVYLVQGFLPIGTSPPEWLDKSLIRFEPGAARAFVIEGPDPAGRVRLERGEDGTWGIVEPSPGPAEATKAEEWLRTFGYCSFKDVAALGGGSAFGLDAPSLRLRAELQDGTHRELVVGTKTEKEEYHVSKGGGDPYVYLLQAWTIDQQLKKTAADFAPPPPKEEAAPPSGEGTPAEVPPAAGAETRPSGGAEEGPK